MNNSKAHEISEKLGFYVSEGMQQALVDNLVEDGWSADAADEAANDPDNWQEDPEAIGTGMANLQTGFDAYGQEEVNDTRA